MPEQLTLIALCVLVVAFLYSCVGHAGASGYIAVMSLFSIAPGVIKPTALMLNILVACLGTYQFWRAGHFSWRLFWPFGLLSVPFAFLGGYWDLPTHVFKILVGVVLLLSAARFLIRPPDTKTAAALSALFILVNSISGLLGNFSATQTLPRFALPLAAAALLGGAAGSYLGSRRFPVTTIKRLLAIVLTIAGLKLIFT